MKTYKFTFKLKGETMPRIKFIPSFSEDEAKTEFLWIVRTCYDQIPEILNIEEVPRNGAPKNTIN